MKLWLSAVLVVALASAALAAGPTLTVSPDHIPQEKATVTISWNGIPNPSPADFIAVFDYPTPANRIPWALLNNTAGAASGSFSMDLLNWRTGYQFVYVSVQNQVKANVVSSNVVTCNKVYPTQIHIAVADPPKNSKLASMRAKWVSGSNINTPTVVFGYKPDLSDGFKASGSSVTYSVNDMCGMNAAMYFLDPGYIHDAVMQGLNPGQTVFYKVGNDVDGYSPILSFQAPPVTGPNNAISMFAFGDSGVSFCQNMRGWCQQPAGQTYANIQADMAANSNFSLLLHIGDISYAVGYANRWESFFHEISPMATRLPYMVCIGNHEYDYLGQPFKPSWGNYANDSYGECGIPYWSRFKMPGQSKQSLWYSFDYGNVHFTFMSTEHDCTPGSEQHAWIQRDLASVDRSRTPFVVFSGHRPMYTSEYYPANVTYMDGLRDAVEPLLLKYQVDLAMWGHVHSYERTCPVFNKHCVDGATTHVVIGMAGMKLTPAWAVEPDWIVTRDINYGYTRLFTTPDALHFQYVKNDGQVIGDEFSLKRRF